MATSRMVPWKQLEEDLQPTMSAFRPLLLRLLAAWGTSEALPALYAFCDALSDPKEREEGEQVISHIRHRMGNAGAGQLSMIAPLEDEGQLSLSDKGGDGQLSLSNEEAGQLSVSEEQDGQLSVTSGVEGSVAIVPLVTEREH